MLFPSSCTLERTCNGLKVSLLLQVNLKEESGVYPIEWIHFSDARQMNRLKAGYYQLVPGQDLARYEACQIE